MAVQQLTVSKAAKLVATLDMNDAEELIASAQIHTSREIDAEVARRQGRATEQATEQVIERAPEYATGPADTTQPTAHTAHQVPSQSPAQTINQTANHIVPDKQPEPKFATKSATKPALDSSREEKSDRRRPLSAHETHSLNARDRGRCGKRSGGAVFQICRQDCKTFASRSRLRDRKRTSYRWGFMASNWLRAGAWWFSTLMVLMVISANAASSVVPNSAPNSVPNLAPNSAPNSAAGIDLHIRFDRRHSAEPQQWRTVVRSELVPGQYEQDVDHFGANPGQKFHQRFWIDSSNAANHENAPVLYHVCGEDNCAYGYFLNDNAKAWAKALGAHIVYLEHRYYGESFPFGDISAEHLRPLTLGNVLEDLASFQRWISRQHNWSGKWIVIGGSYSGTLAALYRQKHPELVVGALAASAPMIAGLGGESGTQTDVSYLSSIEASPDASDRQWTYQACTSFGFWVASGAEAGSDLWRPSTWLCQQVFGGDVPLVSVTDYNQLYDAPFISDQPGAPTNILFTYGSDDVWTAIGLAQQKNLNPGIDILTINHAGHHEDLNLPSANDNADILHAREVFLERARAWLSLGN